MYAVFWRILLRSIINECHPYLEQIYLLQKLAGLQLQEANEAYQLTASNGFTTIRRLMKWIAQSPQSGAKHAKLGTPRHDSIVLTSCDAISQPSIHGWGLAALCPSTSPESMQRLCPVVTPDPAITAGPFLAT